MLLGEGPSSVSGSNDTGRRSSAANGKTELIRVLSERALDKVIEQH